MVKYVGMKCTENRKTLLLIAVLCFFSVFRAALPVEAELVENSWDETKRVHNLRRNIPVAVNVYTKNGTIPQVRHEEGIFAGVEYDILYVDPSEDTFLQVDYYGGAMLLSDLYDYDLVASGYSRVGGINASFFSGSGPVGAVRRNNAWMTFGGVELSPSYGNGFATAYFNNTDMELRYHGWSGSAWIPYDDGIWVGEQTGEHAYGIDSKFAVSGSYTYFAGGVQTDLTGRLNSTGYGGWCRGMSLLAQMSDKQYMLVNVYGNITDANVVELLKSKGDVTDAIRFDGGGSTQMVYDDELVNIPYVKSDYPERVDDTPLFGWGAVSAGYPEEKKTEGHWKVITVEYEEKIVYESEIPGGSYFTIIDEDNHVLLDHMKMDTSLNLILKSTSKPEKHGVLEGKTLYFYNQERGGFRDFLRTGSETNLGLLLVQDDVIPEKDSYQVYFVHHGEQVFTYEGNSGVSAVIKTGENTSTLTFNDACTAELSEYDDRALSWEVSGTAANPVFEAVYPAEKESLLGSVRTLFASVLGNAKK